jgi:phosphoribosylformylglycinamidine synthase subunit PurQ / glutaminase
MKAAVITYPGSNCDRDLAVAFEAAGAEVVRVWHKDSTLPAGHRCGGPAGRLLFRGLSALRGHRRARAHHPRRVDFAGRGGHVLGICNGFQVLVESGLLPGALMRNAGLKFLCKPVDLVVAQPTARSPRYTQGQTMTIPIAHHDGNYQADDETLARLRAEGRVAFRYLDTPNGARDDIAGILSANRRVLGHDAPSGARD